MPPKTRQILLTSDLLSIIPAQFVIQSQPPLVPVVSRKRSDPK